MALKKILLYNNRKIDPVVFDASTPELEEQAFLKLFDVLDNDWQCYSYNALPKLQQALYSASKSGDGKAAKKLCELRKNCEYESFNLINVQ